MVPKVRKRPTKGESRVLRDVPLPSAQDAVPGAATGAVATWASILVPETVADVRQWRMLEGGRLLCTPEGKKMRLTPSERILMARLMMVAGRPVHRRHIVPLCDEGSPNSARSADVQISRLRDKAKQCGLALPVLAVRRWGYLFAVPPSAVAIDDVKKSWTEDSDRYTSMDESRPD